ncbi:hypothetical protein [Streptomyces resistomycificus]|uniref:Uncharacterized protein n=1 Tax=Streptomyces resistomycificus TaxID=67356 RepID=A0A0L8L6N0_9ACTN|nr:hypothetical protein [Streptomyces resistomycificus]KOG33721.1 hypothetical protein ADK37_21630 [Streptomyces resistomycificus]KUN93941.1 hypothetical protein AQJ84_28910 [Streptomyces resistomycificus]
MLKSLRVQRDRPSGEDGVVVGGLRDMRRTRIEKRRRSGRTDRTTNDPYAPYDSLDPRDPDIVRAKRLIEERRGTGRHL